MLQNFKRQYLFWLIRFKYIHLLHTSIYITLLCMKIECKSDKKKKRKKKTLRWKIRVRASTFYSHCIYTWPSIYMYFYLTNIASYSTIHLSTPSNPYHRSHEFFWSTLTRGTILFIGWTIWVGRVHGAALRVSNSDFH